MVCKVNVAKTVVYEGPHKRLPILLYCYFHNGLFSHPLIKPSMYIGTLGC